MRTCSLVHVSWVNLRVECSRIMRVCFSVASCENRVYQEDGGCVCVCQLFRRQRSVRQAHDKHKVWVWLVELFSQSRSCATQISRKPCSLRRGKHWNRVRSTAVRTAAVKITDGCTRSEVKSRSCDTFALHTDASCKLNLTRRLQSVFN